MATRYYSATSRNGERVHLVEPGFRRGYSGYAFSLCPTQVPKSEVQVHHGFHPVSWWELRYEAEICSHCRDVAREKQQPETV